MKAIATTRYGDPNVLALVELPDPKVGPDSVLVRAKCAGVNPVDWKILAGKMDAVLRVHFPLVPGWDVAGVVERVGAAITELAPGDEVIGYVREDHVQNGTYAELVAAPVKAAGGRYIFVRPSTRDLETLGALADAGTLAVPIAEAMPLARAAEALEMNRQGHTRGKIVLDIA
jgi:NADPH:quinone reductase-like Zn-dependent oxidoreductase